MLPAISGVQPSPLRAGNNALVVWKFGKRRNIRTSAQNLDAAAERHLEEFVATRRGLEAFIEQPTTFNPASLLLIAFDGEWTRRSVPDVAWARRFAKRHRLPSYDAGVVGYPQRMRDYDQRRRQER
jgi:hypothetical protein